MMRVEVNRLPYDGFKEISLRASLLNAVRSFSFTTASTDFGDFRLKVGNSIRIYVDEQLRLDGFIEKLQRTQSAGQDLFTLAGRTKTGDLIDSSIDSRVQFRGKQSLRTVAETLIGYLENSIVPGAAPLPAIIAPAIEPFIKVAIDEDIEDFRDDEDLNEEPGQKYIEIIEKFARKRSVLVTTNGNGDLVFTRGRGNSPSPFVIRNTADNQNNNILKEMSVSYDGTKRFNVYRAASQPARGDISKLSEITPENLILTSDFVIDPNIRTTRQKYLIAENPSSQNDCQDRTRWEAVKIQSESIIYDVLMQGHSLGENVWDSNIAVNVLDDYADINGKMLVRDVIFRESESGGSTTKLVCVNPGAYAFPEIPVQEQIGNRYSDLPLGFF